VPLLWPWRKTAFHLLPKRLRLCTGGVVENVLARLLLLALFGLLRR